MNHRAILMGAAIWAGATLTGCSPVPPSPTVLDFPEGRLDLRSWNFDVQGWVRPQGWLWDPGVLWSPAAGGRSMELPPPQPLGPPDQGGAFTQQWKAGTPGEGRRVMVATAWMSVLVDDHRAYGLQIGAWPGALRVWINGVLVWESGVLSVNPGLYRAHGLGTLITVQPHNGLLEVVAEMASSDPLVRHPEMNRYWVLGPAVPMVAEEKSERLWRFLQATILVFAFVAYLWAAHRRPEHRALTAMALFLGICLLKILFNVEQPEPLISPAVSFLPLSVFLFLNHGLNLLPFPLMVLFLHRQFPRDVGRRSLVTVTIATLLVTVWELLPFVLLSMGWIAGYETILQGPWTFVLNFFTVVMILFTIERIYYVFSQKRPLSTALFFGSCLMGLLILIPIPLSYFMPVRYTYFLGWGLFLFLIVLSSELARFHGRVNDDEMKSLVSRLNRRETLARLVAPGWAAWLGRESVEDLRPGDQRTREAILVQIRSSAPAELWLPAVHAAASTRQALLVDWSAGKGTWALDAWAETALAFALEIQRKLVPQADHLVRILVIRAEVNFRILDMGSHWLPVVSGLPEERWKDLAHKAERYGGQIVLDAALQDGLAIGGWRRHRHLTVSGREIELYEGEEEALARLKDKTVDSFEAALAHARADQMTEAIQALFLVIQDNPFDLAARTLLTEWGPLKPS